jgi:hypothetical protein
MRGRTSFRSCSFLSLFFSDEEPELVLVLVLFYLFIFWSSTNLHLFLLFHFWFLFCFFLIITFLLVLVLLFIFLIYLQILYVRLLIWRIKFSFGFDKVDRRNSIKLKSLTSNKNIYCCLFNGLNYYTGNVVKHISKIHFQ